MKEEHRDRRSVRWIETLAKDFRYGLSLLKRDPGFAFVAISVMAIGIGANTAMFSLMDAVLLKPLPYPEPERIVRVWEAPTPTSRNGISTLNFVDWKRLSTSFEALSADTRPERGADRARRAGTAVGDAGVGRLLRGLRREGGAWPDVSPGRRSAWCEPGRSARAMPRGRRASEGTPRS